MIHAGNKSLDASGGSVFLNELYAAQGALNRAAASTPTFGGAEACRRTSIRGERNG